LNRTLWAGIALVLAAVLLGFVTASLAGIDTPVFKLLAMTRAQSPRWAIAATQATSLLGNAGTRSWIVIAVLAALIYRQCWRSALVYLVTVPVAIVGHSVMKEVFARARPTLVPWFDHADTYAYPSGHAAGSMVVLLLGSLLIGDRRLVGVAVVLSLAIGLSRVALGVHWPSDVIGGWTYGGGMALIGYAVAKQVQRPKVKQAS
jgi:membrane-associated phospholipid phosphatase